MTFKIRPLFIILFFAVALASLFHYLPSMVDSGVILYLRSMPTKNLVLTGSPVLCEMAKTRISEESPSEREQTYKEIISLLKWPGAEFKDKVSSLDQKRRLLDFLKEDNSASDGGFYFAQKCLVETLTLFQEHLQETLETLIHSDLVKAGRDSQMFMQLQLVINDVCHNQNSCAEVFKKEILKYKDINLVRIYISGLIRTGESGYRAAFEILDSLNESELSEPHTPVKLVTQSLFSGLRTVDAAHRPLIQQMLMTRLQDVTYPKTKKDFLREFNQPPKESFGFQTYLPDILTRGRELLKSYKTSLPSSTLELQNWASMLQTIQPENATPEEQSELSLLIGEIFSWIIENMGPDANIVEQLLSRMSNAKIFEQLPPPPQAHKFTENEKLRIIGIRLLALQKPLPLATQKAIVENFKKSSFDIKKQILEILYRQKYSSQSLIFELSEQLTSDEFVQEIHIFRANTDDYLLNWKKNQNSPRDPSTQANYQWRGYLLGVNTNEKNELQTFWQKNTQCSEERFIQIQSFLKKVNLKKEDISFLKSYLHCYPQNAHLQKNIEEIIKTTAQFSEETKKEVERWIIESKELNSSHKEELKNILRMARETTDFLE